MKLPRKFYLQGVPMIHNAVGGGKKLFNAVRYHNDCIHEADDWRVSAWILHHSVEGTNELDFTPIDMREIDVQWIYVPENPENEIIDVIPVAGE